MSGFVALSLPHWAVLGAGSPGLLGSQSGNWLGSVGNIK